ncbi:MAG: hypothetical protein ABSG43_26780 [Solirubrobacteraceae bacterium]
MFDPDHLDAIRVSIRQQTERDRHLLDDLRADVRAHLRGGAAVRPHVATAMSLVASDGGNNKLIFDPFNIHLVRVVDSLGRQLFLDVISPTSDPDDLYAAHAHANDPLGSLMSDLGVTSLHDLSPMVPKGELARDRPELVSPSWVLVYRDLCEWAVLYHRICHTEFANHTLLVRDGLLRSKIFRGELFTDMARRMAERIQAVRPLKLYLVGIAKHSQVLSRYRLAMALENALPAGEPRFVRVPRELERKVYTWPEYARGPEEAEEEGGEAAKYVIGALYLTRFGKSSGDPIWAVDVFWTQTNADAEVFGYLLADSVEGFPVPYYPRCLQQAHEHAEFVDFDFEILQDTVFDAARGLVEPGGRHAFDQMRFAPDVANRRYE